MEQPGLNFVSQRADQATKLRSWFLACLDYEKDWVKGRALCAILATNERVLRTIADRSKGQVISGDKGYKLTKYASVEEIDHAERRLLSQARKMTERATEIRKCRNAGGRAA